MDLLKISHGHSNTKLAKNPYKMITISLLSGHSCPFANDCKSMAVMTDKGLRIVDGPETKFRCFSASGEVRQPAVYNQRLYNLNLLKKWQKESKLEDGIFQSIMRQIGPAKWVRMHIGGDFYSKKYFDATIEAARRLDEFGIKMYFYTKAIRWSLGIKDVPKNLSINLSHGGKEDDVLNDAVLKPPYKRAIVVHSEDYARELGLSVDYDDTIAMDQNSGDFALVIHGTQKKQAREYRAAI